MSSASILWQRLDQPGMESARLTHATSVWLLEGTTLLDHEDQPCCLSYRVRCDHDWQTREGEVYGWIGARPVKVKLSVNADLEWQLDGRPYPKVAGCVDVDLNFSPSTNLLPIRRLGLAVGEEAAVRAAWLRFPSLELVPLDQVYRRIGPSKYTYQSGGGSFSAEVEVTSEGFARRYGEIWRATSMV